MNKKAIVLLSGGLDSSISLKLVMEQGIECIGIKFTSPFCTCDNGGKCFSKNIADQFGIEYISLPKGIEFLDIIKSPIHGYGRGLNPCIDCRIYILKKAKEIMADIGASFIVTGEVLGQRPMSQHRRAMDIIETESGLEGKLLRPLSAKYLPKTEAEISGIIDASKFPEIEGRSRKKQLELSKEFSIEDYSCAGGGCLLTEEKFAVKLEDLFQYAEKVNYKDIIKLKKGRHFRYLKSKIICGRNEEENKTIILQKDIDDLIFEVENGMGSTVVLTGEKSPDAIELAAKITAFYSDERAQSNDVKMTGTGNDRIIRVHPVLQEEIEKYNLTNKKLEARKRYYKNGN